MSRQREAAWTQPLEASGDDFPTQIGPTAPRQPPVPAPAEPPASVDPDDFPTLIGDAPAQKHIPAPPPAPPIKR